MALSGELERQGNWLFRWRSYLPLLGMPVAVAAMASVHWPFGSFEFHQAWEILCLAVSFAGLAIRAITVGHAPIGTSGRNTTEQVAWSLNTTGMYSIVRHPLYFGNYLIGLGAVFVPFVWWLPLLYSTAYWLYYERIMLAEEAFLQQQFGKTFEQWSNATPTFVPKLSLWRRPAEPFSLRFVLRKEYTGLAVVVLLHTAIEISEHLVIDHRFIMEPIWKAFFAAGTSAYLLLRFLKRKTRILDVPER